MSELTIFGGFAHRWGAICVGDERTDGIRRFGSWLEGIELREPAVIE
jgi:hypothetical protein